MFVPCVSCEYDEVVAFDMAPLVTLLCLIIMFVCLSFNNHYCYCCCDTVVILL